MGEILLMIRHHGTGSCRREIDRSGLRRSRGSLFAMSSKPTTPEQPAPAPAPGGPRPRREADLAEPGPDEVRPPERFVEIGDRLVPEGDMIPTMPIPTLR
jgi:hypothetical protein